MAKEIERKYLLSGLPAGAADGEDIRQGYLSTGDPEVRLRSKAGRFFATRKGGEGFVRTEEEVEISKEVFDILWPATEGRRVEKIRYCLTGPDGLVWEIDEYRGPLEGLFTAEVELPDDSAAPVMPTAIAEVLIADVTLDKRYKNKALAIAGMPADQ